MAGLRQSIGTGVPGDLRLVLAGQVVRAFGYGLGAVLLGRTLAGLHLDSTRSGLVLAARSASRRKTTD
jgi:hypothetical protein